MATAAQNITARRFIPHGSLLNDNLRAELAALGDDGIAELLGELLDASIATPFDPSDELLDAMHPIAEAYREAFPLVPVNDPDASFWDRVDELYERRRDQGVGSW